MSLKWGTCHVVIASLRLQKWALLGGGCKPVVFPPQVWPRPPEWLPKVMRGGYVKLVEEGGY